MAPTEDPTGGIHRRRAVRRTASREPRRRLPGSANPRSSRSIKRNGEKASCSSTTPISFFGDLGGKEGPLRGQPGGGEGREIRSVHQRQRLEGLTDPGHGGRTFPAFLSTTATAPSEMDEQWRRCSGRATARLERTSFAVTGVRNWAYGFRSAARRARTVIASNTAVSTSYCSAYRWLTRAARAGMVAPTDCSEGWREWARAAATSAVGRSVIFSTATTSARSW